MSQDNKILIELIKNNSPEANEDLVLRLNYKTKLDLVMSDLEANKSEVANLVLGVVFSIDERYKNEKLEAMAIMSAIAEKELAHKQAGGSSHPSREAYIKEFAFDITHYNLIHDKVEQAILVANTYEVKDERVAKDYLNGTINDEIAKDYIIEKDLNPNYAQFIGHTMDSKQIMDIYNKEVRKDEAAKIRVEAVMMSTKDLGLDTGNFYAIEMADKKVVLFKDRFTEKEQQLLNEVAPEGKLKINNKDKSLNGVKTELSFFEKVVRVVEKALTRIKNIGKSKEHQKENRVVLKGGLRERTRSAKAATVIREKGDEQFRGR